MSSLGEIMAQLDLRYDPIPSKPVVYIGYKLGETPEDIRVIGVFSSEREVARHLDIFDCYRMAVLDEVLAPPTFSDLYYKTEDGFYTVE